MIVTLPKLAAEAVGSILGLRHAARLWILPRALDKPKSSFFINILRRRSPKRVALGKVDRLVLRGLYRLSPTVLNALKILQPETVIRRHRAGCASS